MDIAVVAEKPSVARDIAKVLGARTRGCAILPRVKAPWSIVEAALVTHGNRFLAGTPIDVPRLEAALGVELRRATAGANVTVVVLGDASFEAWLRALRSAGTERLALCEDGSLASFGREGCGVTWVRRNGPSSTLTGRDIVEFVQASAHADALRVGLLQENNLNYHWYAGDDWNGLARALGDLADGELEGAMELVVGHESVTDADRERWYAIADGHAIEPSIRFMRGVVVSLPVCRPLEEQREILRRAIRDLRDHCLAHGEGHWADRLDRALATLDAPPRWSDPPLEVLSHVGLPDAAGSLLRASLDAQVFGGMGSFNDTLASGTGRGPELCAELWKQLAASPPAAVGAQEP